jgi:hypothetical protein
MSIARSLVAQLTERGVQHTLTGNRPASAADGVDLATWKSGGAYGPVTAQIYLDGTAAATIAAPAGGSAGVELWGFKLDQWWLVDVLHAGASIPIASDTLGDTERIDDIGAFDRLFVAGTPSAGAVTARFVPFEVLR